MGDTYPKVKVAAVQAAPVFLKREPTTEKACRLIREAGQNGARVIGFPEGFIPGHPQWYHHHAATGPIANHLAMELYKNAVEIPGPEVMALCAAARDAKAYVVMGVCERLPNRLGTMYNTQIQIGPDGTLIGKHQKIMPTVGERLVHANGFGDTLGTFSTEFGPMSGLICGENANPLAVFALTAQGTRIHVMSWPSYFTLRAALMRNRVQMDSQAFGNMAGAFVISACGTVDETMLETLQLTPEDEKIVRDPTVSGGSIITGPGGSILAGPMGPEEGILYAECDFERSLFMKIRQDFAGHYNRPDIFQLHMNQAAPQLYSAWNGQNGPAVLDGGVRPSAITASTPAGHQAPPLTLTMQTSTAEERET